MEAGHYRVCPGNSIILFGIQAEQEPGSAGVLECWSAGVLECWSAGVLECWSAGVLECWSAGVLECWSAGVLECSTIRIGNKRLEVKVLSLPVLGVRHAGLMS